MDKLFVTIKRILIPMLTALILVSSVAPAQALTTEDIRSFLAETPYITLEVPVATEQAPAERESVVIELDTTQVLAAAPTTKPAPPATLAGGYDNVLGWYPTAMLDNFPAMRSQVEDIFDVSSLFGQKTGILYPEDNQAASLLNFFATPNARYKNNYNYALTKMPELKAAASKTFTDIKGTEWFADKLVLSTYYGVIAGKPDGNNFKFDPNGQIGRAHV